MFTINNIDSRFQKLDLTSFIPKTVVFSGPINEANAKTFIKEFCEVHSFCKEKGQPIIPLIIDSYGGDVYACLNMMSVITGSDIPVATIVLGKAMSAGAILFSAGKERYMAPGATVMIHQVASFALGKVDDIKNTIEQATKLDNKLFELLDTNCEQPDGYFRELLCANKNVDLFLDTQQCLLHKLATHIGIPTMGMSISLDYQFKL